jgi:hypothetical protein
MDIKKDISHKKRRDPKKGKKTSAFSPRLPVCEPIIVDRMKFLPGILLRDEVPFTDPRWEEVINTILAEPDNVYWDDLRDPLGIPARVIPLSPKTRVERILKKIYICGPMTKRVDYDKKGFDSAVKFLTDHDYDVMNVYCDDPETGHRMKGLGNDIKTLVDCDMIYMLPGWENNEDAVLEKHIADKLGIKQFTLADLL